MINIFLVILLNILLLATVRGDEYVCNSEARWCVFKGVKITTERDCKSAVFRGSDDNETIFKFSDSNLTIFPKHIFKTFPTMNELHANGQSISKNIFISSSLIELHASSNKITGIEIEEKISSQLKYLDLTDNKIEDISNITRLENLEELWLCFNYIETFNFNIFHKMKNLKKIILRSNKIWRIENNMFVRLPSVTYLGLSGNKLTYFDLRVLHSFPNLEEFYIHGNELVYFENQNIKKYCPKLNTVHFHDNDLNCAMLKKVLPYFKKTGISYQREWYNCYRSVDGVCCSFGQSRQDYLNFYFDKSLLELQLNRNELLLLSNNTLDYGIHDVHSQIDAIWTQSYGLRAENEILKTKAHDLELTATTLKEEVEILKKLNEKLFSSVQQMKDEIALLSTSKKIQNQKGKN